MIKYQTFSNQQNELQKPCVATIGKFDGVHAGHRKLLNLVIDNVKKNGLVSTVITFDPHPKDYFEGDFQYLQTLDEKIKDILSLGINQVVVLEFNEYLENLSAANFFEQIIIEELNVQSLLVGEDFAFGKNRNCDIECLTELCKSKNIELKVITKLKEKGEVVSSSRIRESRGKRCN